MSDRIWVLQKERVRERQAGIGRKKERRTEERKNDKERYVIAQFCVVEQNWNLVAVTQGEIRVGLKGVWKERSDKCKRYTDEGIKRESRL